MRELIERRRRQVLVHSILYYRLDQNLVTDVQFDAWATELCRLQEQHVRVAAEVEWHRDAFSTFDGSTGFDLPLDDPAATSTALRLLAYRRRVAAGEIDTALQIMGPDGPLDGLGTT